MGAPDNTGTGKERYNISHHRRRRSGLSQTQRQGRGKEEPSVYKIPIINFQINGLNVIPAPSIASTSAAPISISASAEMSDSDMATNRDTRSTEMGEQPVKGFYQWLQARRRDRLPRRVRFANEDAGAT
ncbi:hypothetical protein BYT27DRAFT_7190907 [Phlegmacium glaucopus]|nr:hypothetical protein BYT27DRAFT_7190907 [Phlegmacium glaucopus]